MYKNIYLNSIYGGTGYGYADYTEPDVAVISSLVTFDFASLGLNEAIWNVDGSNYPTLVNLDNTPTYSGNE